MFNPWGKRSKTAFICDICAKAYDRRPEYQAHLAKNHNYVYTCIVAGCIVFDSNMEAIKKHLWDEHQINSYANTTPPYIWYAMALIHNTVNTPLHGEGEEAAFKPVESCQECAKGFLRKQDNLEHHNSVHKQVHRCRIANDAGRICDSLFTSRDYLEKHLFIHHEAKLHSQTYQFDIVQYTGHCECHHTSFIDMYSYNQHVQKYYREGYTKRGASRISEENVYVCDLFHADGMRCDWACLSDAEIVKHQGTVHKVVASHEQKTFCIDSYPYYKEWIQRNNC